MTKLDYRAAVGPPDNYDIIGAMQFNILVAHGLREHHRLLDIGCGSLRGGRFFIIYLKSGNYYGIEPNESLVAEGITNELNLDLVQRKNPTFDNNDNCNTEVFGATFDYILAQSIFSHAPRPLIRACLKSVKQTLARNGKFLYTFFPGTSNYTGDTWTQNPDARYAQDWLVKIATNYGLVTHQLTYHHPSGQRWMVITHA